MTDAWTRFTEIYPRNWATTAGIERAHRLFDDVVTSGRATADQLIAGAELYAIERAGKDIDFTAAPFNWLRDGRWRLPSKSKIRHRSPRRSSARR